MNAKHTPGTWETGAVMTNVEHWPEGWNAPVRIADCHLKNGEPESSAECVANAAFIVRAVNAHDDLVAAAEDVLLDMAANTANGLSVKSAYEQWASLERLRAALKKARGE